MNGLRCGCGYAIVFLLGRQRTSRLAAPPSSSSLPPGEGRERERIGDGRGSKACPALVASPCRFFGHQARLVADENTDGRGEGFGMRGCLDPSLLLFVLLRGTLTAAA